MSEAQFLPVILDPVVRGKADTSAETEHSRFPSHLPCPDAALASDYFLLRHG